MAYNRIPLALAYDGNTGNASGLVEFTLSSTDLGDFCDDVTPTTGQVPVWNNTCFTPSTLVTGGGGGVTYFSALDDVVTGDPYSTNQLVYCLSPTQIATQTVASAVGTVNLNALADVSDSAPDPRDLLVWQDGTSEWTPQAIDFSFGDQMVRAQQGPDGIRFTVSNAIVSPPGTVGKGDVSDGFVFVSGIDASATEIVGSNFGKIWVQGPVEDLSDQDTFTYFSATDAVSGVASFELNSDAKDFIQYGNAGAGQLDHGALSGLGDNDHPQYLLSAAAITDHGALAGLTDNDHPQYLLSAAAITDHGALGGLGDNDHPQYLLSAAAITDHGALAGLGDDDHPQYRLSATLITNAAMATMGAATVKGSVGGGTPADLSMTQLQSISKVKLRTPFHSDGGAACSLGAHPSTEQFLKNLNINIQIADLSTYSQVRMFCRIYTNSGSSNSPRLIAKYHTSYTTTVGTFSDIGSSEVSTSLASYTLANSGWINLADSAMIDDCYITVTQIGGDSSATPRISSLFMEFR